MLRRRRWRRDLLQNAPASRWPWLQPTLAVQLPPWHALSSGHHLSTLSSSPPAPDWHMSIWPNQIRRLPRPQHRRPPLQIAPFAAPDDDFFAQLEELLQLDSVSGPTLWKYVLSSYPASRYVDISLTGPQRSLLTLVLRRNLDEWAAAPTDPEQGQLLRILRFFSQNQIITPDDWVYCLGFLAKSVYQTTMVDPAQSPNHDPAKELADAIRLRTLSTAWRFFLMEDRCDDDLGPGKAPSGYRLLDSELRHEQRQNEEEGQSDFVQRFMEAAANPHNINDPEMAHRLAYTAMVTLIALYNNLRTFFTTGKDRVASGDGHRDSSDGAVAVEAGKADHLQPNWHLGLGQDSYWAPDISHLSVTEALIVYVLAQATKEAPVNQTLLRIALSQMSIPESDVLAISKTYQGFQMAVPTILERFKAFPYDRAVYKAGLPRRHPLPAQIDVAVASGDIQALDHAVSSSDSSNGPINRLAIIRAYFQMDRPARALTHLKGLPRGSSQRVIGYKVWLKYYLYQGDHKKYETAWRHMTALGMRPNRDMWRQRLRLLFENERSLLAWANFRTLIRFSTHNTKLSFVGRPHRRFADLDLNIGIFHLMISSFLLEKGVAGHLDVAKAVETLDLLRHHRNLRPTRETYMLFIRHALQKGDRPSAANWFSQGRSSDVRFSPSDLVVLFEYDLASRHRDEERPLAKPSSGILPSLDAITRILRLGTGDGLRLRPTGQHVASTILQIAEAMPSLDHIQDSLPDLNMQEIQPVYTEVIHGICQPFAQQLSGQAKQARLRLLLLLWDHCTTLAGIPPSTRMEETLTSLIFRHLHPNLQEKLLRGATLDNYNPQDPMPFHSYRFLRRVGTRWLVDRLGSVVSESVKAKLVENYTWNGYTGLTERSLVSAGVGIEEGARLILDAVQQWQQQAASKRIDGNRQRKESRARKQLGFSGRTDGDGPPATQQDRVETDGGRATQERGSESQDEMDRLQ